MDTLKQLQPTWRPFEDTSSLAIELFREFVNSHCGLSLENVFVQGWTGAALISSSETSGDNEAITTWDQLKCHVSKVANALRASHVGKGDIVAYIGANTPYPIFVFLAAASIGAIFTSLAPDMGEKAIIDRLIQVRPKMLFADNAYQYKGKLYTCMTKLSNVVRKLRQEASLQHAVMMVNVRGIESDATRVNGECFLSSGTDSPLVFEQVPFQHPMLILFSSGTTGAPKGMGVLVNLKKEHVLHNNLGTEDRYYHYSNIGWAMWNIFLGGMLAGATLILYDGSPFYPSPERHIKSIISLGDRATVFGGSPRYFAELMKLNVIPRKFADMSKVRLVHSTGAVLSADIWAWMADAFNGAPIISFSGGTEICGSFLHGTLVHPQYPGEITVKALGIDVDIYDEQGESCRPGIAGELVIKKPFPNAAVFFWNDQDGSRYHSSYFETHPGVWTHGDFAKVNHATHGIIMLGRSDGVLNPSGVRFGSSEIYSAISSFSEIIEDSLCVGQKIDGQDERVLLFLQMCPMVALTENIKERIRGHIAETLSPRHVPHRIISVPSIPYNVNGKKLEVLVKHVLSGGVVDARTKSTLAEEGSLDFFTQFVDDGVNVELRKAKL
ncbi:acetoacetate-CoA ligase [Penicillium riverlandense]|uniref:acetoacetate-CoA ligase n=1 Tax=Penicillium riverlandense TaxID=1903569 RepID=UPI00254859DD|nr:acetoacetate-CoA ligase [Penicillium riverlandense]KAJ5833653.1 acetoacetate-CoA ligase [Penicillium riverlandense]